jgi:hypothetical protein
MMKRMIGTSLLLALAGCGVATPAVAVEEQRSTTGAAGLASPGPFFGENAEARYVAGDIVALTLSPDSRPARSASHEPVSIDDETGTYARRLCYVTPCYDATLQRGTYALSIARSGAGTIRFYGTDKTLGTILLDQYHWRLGAPGELWLQKSDCRRWSLLKQFPDEALCDGSSGQWRDDDPNPDTGLYCDCQTDRYWNPAAGGCVPRR